MKTNAKTTAIYSAIAGCIITIANSLGYSVTGTSTGKTATIAFIAAGLATFVHIVTTHPAVKKAVKAVVRAPVTIVKKAAPKTSAPTTMYDSIDVSQIPVNAKAVAGYVDGRFQTYTKLVSKFPNAKKVAITVIGQNDMFGAEHPCIDVENGDASPVQGSAWIQEQINKGNHPIIYASTSTMVKILELSKLVPRHEFTVWTAHYGAGEHVCDAQCFTKFGGTSAMYADGTQWTDSALGRNLDQSKLNPDFFPGSVAT